MAILKVFEYPEKVLETKASDVESFDDDLRNFVNNLHETMIDANGIGLAANQVGSLQRVLTIFIPFEESRYSDQEGAKQEPWHNQKFTFINPVITKREGKITFQEGCLSFPEIFENVDRSAQVWVTAFDENGKEFSVHAHGLFSVCLQHEIDHLDGIVFINRMSRLKSSMVKKKLSKRGRFSEDD